MDAYEIVDDICKLSENFMHESGMVMQPETFFSGAWFGVKAVLGVRESDAFLVQVQQ